MKGHVKIELLDHKTGERRITEHENMLTNALAYRAGIDSNDTLSLYSNENSLMPLATKGLGGLQLEKTGIWTLRCIINGKRIAKSTVSSRSNL